MVFLVGPPGSGKSALGRRVCTELGVRSVDLVDVGSTAAALQELVRARDADVVKTRGGFGRNGTGCNEYRHLERACEHVLLLVDLSEEVAAQELKALIGDLRSPEPTLQPQHPQHEERTTLPRYSWPSTAPRAGSTGPPSAAGARPGSRR